MSTLLTGLVWELPPEVDISLGAHHVLLCLADRANPDTAQCWPGIKDIARRCRISERSVRNHLTKLKDLKLLKVESRLRGNEARSSNKYTLQLRGFAGAPADSAGGPCRICTTPPAESAGATIEPCLEEKVEPFTEPGGGLWGTEPLEPQPDVPPPRGRVANASPEEEDQPTPTAGPYGTAWNTAYEQQFGHPYPWTAQDDRILGAWHAFFSTASPAKFARIISWCWNHKREFVRRMALTIKGMCQYWAEFSSNESQDNPLPEGDRNMYTCKHCQRRFEHVEQPLPGYKPFCQNCADAGILSHYGMSKHTCSCGQTFFADDNFGSMCPGCLLNKELAA